MPAGCPVTAGTAYTRKAVCSSFGVIGPSRDSPIAKRPATCAEATAVPVANELELGPVIPEGNVGDRMKEDHMDEPAPGTYTPTANTVTAGP